MKSIEECKSILFEVPQLRYFFEVSIPASNARNETLGHVLLVCPDVETKACFIALLESLRSNSNIKATTLLPDLRPSDLGALLTNLTAGDILLIENERLSIEQDCIDIIKNAMANNYLDIIIGKGPAARSVRLDIVPFTAVFCVESNSKALSSLFHQFEYVIKIDNDKLPTLCKAKIKAACHHQITDDACSYIANKAQYDTRTSITYLKRVLEYLDFKHIDTVVTQDLVEEVFSLAGIGITLDDAIETDETIDLLKDIRIFLRDMQEDIHAIRGNLEDFIAANGGDWQ